MKIAIAQLKYKIGDVKYNKLKFLEYFKKAEKDKVDLVIFSELALTGYPPKDLLLQDAFLDEIGKAIDKIAEATKKSKTSILLGTPFLLPKQNVDGIVKREILYNSAILIEEGYIGELAHKNTISNKADFNEHSYFARSMNLRVASIKNKNFVILISDDIYNTKNLFLLKDRKFDGVIVIGSSYFEENKQEERFRVCSKAAKVLGKPIIFANCVGGQDSLIFDGDSFVINKMGEYILRLNDFEEDYRIIETVKKSKELEFVENHTKKQDVNKYEKMYNAAVLGLRDYMKKSGLKKAIVGLSGGIDSATTTLVTTDTIGSKNLILVNMPSRFSSDHSKSDSLEIANNLGVKLKTLEIEPLFQSFIENVKNIEGYTGFNLAEENLQARIRANILMYIANKENALLVNTGNKSENAVGYSTLYGDTCGGYAPIGDIYKTDVYKLAEWRNKNICKLSDFLKTNIIPKNVFKKHPSAELRKDQKDSDSLPEYEILDEVLRLIIEKRKTAKELIHDGFDKKLVEKIYNLFKKSEFKRRQEPLCAKISRITLGLDFDCSL
ncbi:NAD+ synthase [Pseudomonadota bacterium]